MNAKQLEAEINNLKSRLDDTLIEFRVYSERNDYLKAAECSRRITNLSNQLHIRTAHLKDMNNFYGLLSDLQTRGLEMEAIKRYANQT